MGVGVRGVLPSTAIRWRVGLGVGVAFRGKKCPYPAVRESGKGEG